MRPPGVRRCCAWRGFTRSALPLRTGPSPPPPTSSAPPAPPPFPSPADVRRHQQVKRRVGVARKGDRREARLADGDADFFLQLADQRLFRPFAGLDLAAGKLPEARERFALRPLRDQDALVGIDK